MPASESQLRATKKYDNDHYFKKLVRFRKEDEEAIRAAAGKSLNGFIVDAVMEKVRASGLMPNHQGEPEFKRPFTFPPKAKERTREEEVIELQKMQSETKQKMAMQKAELTEEEERNLDRVVSIFGKNEDE